MADRIKSDRKAAPEPLTSPEQLDELMSVTSPRSWLALVGMGLLLIALVVWGFVGRLPKKVQGDGILIRGEQLFQVQSVGEGRLLQILVSAGTEVTQGQVVATIDRSLLVEQIRNAKTQLDELKKQHVELTEFEAKDTVYEIELLASKRSNLTDLIKDYVEEMAWLQEKMTNQQSLLDRGLITRQTLLTTRQSYNTLQQQAQGARTDLRETVNREFQMKNQKQQSILQSQLKINELARKLRELETERDLTTRIISPQNGKVLEVMASADEMAKPGTPILNIEPTGQDLEAVLYLNAGEGKRVRSGMKVEIIPSSYRKEEHGYMIGQIRFVADYPATKLAMMAVMENEQLVDRLSGAGAPITAYATLIKDKATRSGFRWSSSQGPPNEIHSGTVCSASIVVSEQRPITLVMPALRSFLGF